MWNQLYSSQFHYAIHLFGAVVYFAAGWLYFDAYTKNHAYLKSRIIGLFILALGSLVEGMTLQITAQSTQGFMFGSVGRYILPVIGYVSIFLSFPFDPVQSKPVHTFFSSLSMPLRNAYLTLLPVSSLSVALMYFVHVSEGLEWHLLLPAVSFFIITIAEVFNAIQGVFSGTHVIHLANLIAPFGLFWWAEHLMLLIGFIFLMRWVFWYLLKSFEMQVVFISTVSVAILTFFITTFFVYNLSNSLLDEISHQVAQTVKVFSYSIDSKKREALADARFIASDLRLTAAIKDSKEVVIRSIMQEYAISRSIRGLLLVNADGSPLARTDNENILSDGKLYDPAIREVQKGIDTAEMVAVPGVSVPTIYMLAAVPVRSENIVVGAVLLAYSLDSALLQGIKKNLGLEGAIFAGDRLSVTSMRNADALIGMKETNPQIIKDVLVDGKRYEGEVLYNATEYLGSYEPMLDASDTPIGMLYVGRSVGDVYSILFRSIQATYIASTFLLLLSIFPALYVAKYIIYQVH